MYGTLLPAIGVLMTDGERKPPASMFEHFGLLATIGGAPGVGAGAPGGVSEGGAGKVVFFAVPGEVPGAQ